ncbi:hypothetical protein DSO57_1024750, partial [Entomophthora muscae]
SSLRSDIWIVTLRSHSLNGSAKRASALPKLSITSRKAAKCLRLTLNPQNECVYAANLTQSLKKDSKKRCLHLQ